MRKRVVGKVIRFPGRTIFDVINGPLEQAIIDRRINTEKILNKLSIIKSYHYDGADTTFTLSTQLKDDPANDFVINLAKKNELIAGDSPR